MKIKTSQNLYLMWNIGSTISMFMIMQMMTGIIMSSMYFFKSNNMFENSFYIYFNINYGFMMRLMHSNMTSMIFMLMIMHMYRSIMFKNMINKMMWMTGMIMLIMLMMISFMGYSLVWNQMSYWAMMVITNFISSMPMLGNKMIKMMWGNYFINNILINRLFSLHFMMPMMLMMMMMIHMKILHMNKSTNPMGLNNKMDQLNLNPISIIKDSNLMMMLMMIMMNMIMMKPNMMNNKDNFSMMNYFKTPNHIEPEWYFLMFYSILRSIENKMNGLLMMMLMIIMMFMMPFMNQTKFLSNKFIPINKINNTMLMNTMIIMTMMGKKMMEYPFTKINKYSIYIMFMMFMMNSLTTKMMNKTK